MISDLEIMSDVPKIEKKKKKKNIMRINRIKDLLTMSCFTFDTGEMNI